MQKDWWRMEVGWVKELEFLIHLRAAGFVVDEFFE